MSDTQELELMLVQKNTEPQAAPLDAGASPFRTVVDPAMRYRLKKALLDLIDNHDDSLANYVANGQLALDSYKEYIELFARCLRETMETKEGVSYLIKSCGFDMPTDDVNLYPDWRWKSEGPGA